MILNLKAWDIIILIMVLFLSIYSFFLFSINLVAQTVEIKSIDKSYAYDINSSEALEILGPFGSTNIEIQNSTVWISHSDCKDKVCMNMGIISKAGQWLACLPNKIFISISGDDSSNEIDIISF